MRWTLRGGGLALGVAIGLVVLAVTSMPRGTTVLGVDVAIRAVPTGELQVAPSGPFLRADGLRPSTTERAAGEVSLRNQTGSALDVRVRAVTATRSLDEVLAVELSSDGALLFHGPLGGLNSWTPEAVTVGPGRSIDLTARAWVPGSARLVGGYGLADDVMLEFLAEPAR